VQAFTGEGGHILVRARNVGNAAGSEEAFRQALAAAVDRVNAGKTVIVPERNISRGPWTGVGYIVQDETTGAAAYLITAAIVRRFGIQI
jgi:hypothetical protein